MENVRKYRDIQLVKTDKRRNQLVSEPNYYTTQWFSKNLLAIEMKKIKVKVDKPVYLGFIHYTKLVKRKCVNFGMIILNQSFNKM